jgi:uncharacterized membrane protein
VGRFRQKLNSPSAKELAYALGGFLILFNVTMVVVWAVFDPDMLSLWPQLLLLSAVGAIGMMSAVRRQAALERTSQPAPKPPVLAWVLGWAALAGAIVVLVMFVAEVIRTF